MKSQQEIQELKDQWLMDRDWSLEEAEGFEEHKEDLLAFRLEQEAIFERSYAAGARRRFFESPAFSIPATMYSDDSIENPMQPGLSVREYFAAAAMQGFLASGCYTPQEVSLHAVEMADAVIQHLYENPI
jgi:hypothetical protein